MGRVWLEGYPDRACIHRPARRNEIHEPHWMRWPLGRGKAGALHGTKRAIHPVMRATRVARLHRRVCGVMHRHRRHFYPCRHAWMRKGQHEKQRKHKAKAKQQMADNRA